MRTVPLADIVSAAGGRAGDSVDLPVYSVTKHAGFVPSLEYFKKQVFSRDVRSYKVVQPGDFAYATIHLDEGSIGIAPERGLISPMYTVFRADDTMVDAAYLLRFLKSPRALAEYSKFGKGAIHRRKAISLSALGALAVPLPSITEQRRIAKVLGHVDSLRVKRRQVMAHVDTLTQSIFRDMFGDPDDATESIELGVLADLQGGRNLVAADQTAESAYRVLKISAVTTGRFKPEESKPLPLDYIPPAAHLVRNGDLLMSRANTTDLVGSVAYVSSTPNNLALPDKVWRFDWKRDVEPIFVHALLSTPALRRRISRLSSGTGGSMKNVSKAKLNTMLIPEVSLRMQREFTGRTRLVMKQHEIVQEASIRDDHLFLALQSRAFRGNL